MGNFKALFEAIELEQEKGAISDSLSIEAFRGGSRISGKGVHMY